MDEIWKDIKGYEGYYQISNFGNIRSLDRWVKDNGTPVFKQGMLLNPVKQSVGYLQIALNVEGKVKKKYIHRLVMEAFNPTDNPKLEINHIDENKENNMITNLEWVTHKENINKISKYIVARENNQKQKLERREAWIKYRDRNIPPKEVLEKQLFEYRNFVAIGKLYGVTDSAVRRWCRKYGLPDHTGQLKNLS